MSVKKSLSALKLFLRNDTEVRKYYGKRNRLMFLVISLFPAGT